MNPEPLQQYIRLYSYLIIPVSLLEGFIFSRIAQKLQWKRTGFFPHSGAALTLQLLIFFFLTAVPHFVSAKGWRLIPTDHWDNILYFIFVLTIAQTLKLALYYLLFNNFRQNFLRSKQVVGLGILFFWLFNGSILSGSIFYSNEKISESTYNISYSFPYGIDYFIRGRDGSFSDVSLRDVLGRVIPLDQVVPPYSVDEKTVTFFHVGSQDAGKHKVSVSFDSEIKNSADGKITVSTGKYGGLLIIQNGKIIKLNRQSLLHRWGRVEFAIIPEHPCILFAVANENYIFDYHRNILYPLSFKQGRIFALGVRDTAEQHHIIEPEEENFPDMKSQKMQNKNKL